MSDTQYTKPSNPRFHDLSGAVFGRLTVVGYAGKTTGSSLWTCVCTCGGSLVVASSSLKRGLTRSCGCYRQDFPNQTTHGLSKLPEYKVWKGMWSRCTCKSHEAYPRYANRTPPETWRDFATFLRDMGERPTEKHTLERLNNSLPYGPDNCVWELYKVQSRNTSRNVNYTLGEVTMCQKDWAARLGLSTQTLVRRVGLLGEEKALTLRAKRVNL